MVASVGGYHQFISAAYMCSMVASVLVTTSLYWYGQLGGHQS